MQTGASRATTDGSQQPVESVAPKLRLLDQVRQAIRARHYSNRTEKTYVEWFNPFLFSIRKCKIKNGIWQMENEPIYTHVLNKGGRGVSQPCG